MDYQYKLDWKQNFQSHNIASVSLERIAAATGIEMLPKGKCVPSFVCTKVAQICHFAALISRIFEQKFKLKAPFQYECGLRNNGYISKNKT